MYYSDKVPKSKNRSTVTQFKKSDHYLVQTLKLICTCYFNLNTFVFLLGFYNQDTKIGTGIYEYDL